jgi:trans-aconitate 2-methyltransferase
MQDSLPETCVIDSWDPRQYDRFQREREQPFFDLMALVRPVHGMRIVDLGCGTGKLTRILHDRLQAGETTGIDRSDRMLAETRVGALPAGLRFEVGTIESFVTRAAEASGPTAVCDLIFSNAALHWVEDHEAFLPKLGAALAPDGQLAFQVPAQHDSLSHVLAEELTTLEPFRSALGGWHRPQPVLAPEAYARLLYRCGFEDPIVRLIVYPHVLAGPDEVVEWMKGTLLTEYARYLPADLFALFVQEYRTRLIARLDTTRPFFFPFKRIICWGQRSGCLPRG